jgi:hypothetical protein
LIRLRAKEHGEDRYALEIGAKLIANRRDDARRYAVDEAFR